MRAIEEARAPPKRKQIREQILNDQAAPSSSVERAAAKQAKTTNQQKSPQSVARQRRSPPEGEGGAPQTMLGPGIGALVGGGISACGAGYYFFFMQNDDDGESSLVDSVVGSIRGMAGSEDSDESGELSLEDYEKQQAENRKLFKQQLEKLNEVKSEPLQLGSSAGGKSADNAGGEDGDGSVDQVATAQKDEKQLSLRERLALAEQRGKTAGVPKHKIKRRSAAAFDKIAGKSNDSVPSEPSGTPSPVIQDSSPIGALNSKPDWMKEVDAKIASESRAASLEQEKKKEKEKQEQEQQQQHGQSEMNAADSTSNSGVSPEPQGDHITSGLESLLEKTRQSEAEYKRRFGLESTFLSRFFGGRRGRSSSGGDSAAASAHEAALQRFRDEKQRLKNSIRERKLAQRGN